MFYRLGKKIRWNATSFRTTCLSGCFYQLFNANTVSVHVGKEIATVDIQGI